LKKLGDDAEGLGFGNCLCAVMHIQFSEDVIDVNFYCGNREMQPVSNFLIGKALRDQLDDLRFSGG
jgi:hypothetical protein